MIVVLYIIAGLKGTHLLVYQLNPFTTQLQKIAILDLLKRCVKWCYSGLSSVFKFHIICPQTTKLNLNCYFILGSKRKQQ